MCLEACGPQFSRLATTHRKRPEVGPCSVVLHRLGQIQWKWDEAGFFRDAWGAAIDLWNMPIQELASRTAEAWRYRIACEASSRQTFAGLSLCCAAFSIEAMTKHPRDRAIMRSAMSGTFFTADHLKYRDTPGDTRCKMCMQPDSLYHRNWECEALQECRKSLTSAQQQEILSMPAATHLQGWFPTPSELPVFRALFKSLPPAIGCLIPQPPIALKAGEPLHYLTDGACLRPHDKYARICGWGVVQAHPHDLWSFCPVASGCLPGQHQTVVRAEITAATAAAHDAARKDHPFCLWSDNARVVSLLQQMFAMPDHQWNTKTANHDLINELTSLFREVAHLCKGIFKVASHQQTKASTKPPE
eukprot:s2429_g19.t1